MSADRTFSSKIIFPGLLLGTLILLLASVFFLNAPSERDATPARQIPAFAVPLLEDGKISENSTLNHTALAGEDIKIVNFFASWCLPCEAEHPLLSHLADRASVYGIGYMDAPAPLTSFLNRLGNPYQKVGIDQNGDSGNAWAIKGLPTTFVIGPDGQILYRLDAPLTPAQVKTITSYLDS